MHSTYGMLLAAKCNAWTSPGLLSGNRTYTILANNCMYIDIICYIRYLQYKNYQKWFVLCKSILQYLLSLWFILVYDSTHRIRQSRSIGRISQVGNLPYECQREASAQLSKKYLFFFSFYFIQSTKSSTMCMLGEHSDALSLPSDVRRTSDFQKSERNSAYKTSHLQNGRMPYVIRQMNGKSLPKLWHRKG